MPDRCSIFKDWANYCGIEMEKLVLWDSSSLKLFQKIEKNVEKEKKLFRGEL